jgi:putative Ca2+/H+ antiporter (TMEM165/GDT1 family)
MDSILKAIETLQRTPVPNLLIILGGVFLLLAFVGRIGATIEMPPSRQKLAGIVGALFLIAGIVVSWPTKQDSASQKDRSAEMRPGPRTPDPPPEPKPTPKPMPIKPATQDPVIPASGDTAKIGSLVYKVLAAQLDRSVPGKLSLSFRIRLTTQNDYAALHHDSFRLLVNDVPQAPEMEPQLLEIVNSNSAKEGTIRFVIPDAESDVKLQIIGEGIYRDEKRVISINLGAAKP